MHIARMSIVPKLLDCHNSDDEKILQEFVQKLSQFSILSRFLLVTVCHLVS